MNTRPAWGVLLLGALVVAALVLSPIWLNYFSDQFVQEEEAAPFPPEFYQLSSQVQDYYLDLYEGATRQMAIDMVAERLATPVGVEEPNLPALDADPSQVSQLLTGSFVTLDPMRSATGAATLYRLSDGRMLLRLENLDAIGGPDLHVLLSAYPRPSTPEELEQVSQHQIDLGPLKGNQGNQNYLINEPTFNVDNYASGSVVLYSTRYDLVFSFASLSASTSTSGV